MRMIFPWRFIQTHCFHDRLIRRKSLQEIIESRGDNQTNEADSMDLMLPNGGRQYRNEKWIGWHHKVLQEDSEKVHQQLFYLQICHRQWRISYSSGKLVMSGRVNIRRKDSLKGRVFEKPSPYILILRR